MGTVPDGTVPEKHNVGDCPFRDCPLFRPSRLRPRLGRSSRCRSIRHNQRAVRGGRKSRLGGVGKFDAVARELFDNGNADGVPCLEHFLDIIAVHIEHQLEIKRAGTEGRKACADEFRAMGLDNFLEQIRHPCGHGGRGLVDEVDREDDAAINSQRGCW